MDKEFKNKEESKRQKIFSSRSLRMLEACGQSLNNKSLISENVEQHNKARTKDEASKKLKRAVDSDYDKSTTKLTEFKESDYEAERKEKIERMKSVSFRSVRMLEACGQSLDNFFSTKTNNEKRNEIPIEMCSEDKASKNIKEIIDLDCNESEVELAKLREPGDEKEVQEKGEIIEQPSEISEEDESEDEYEAESMRILRRAFDPEYNESDDLNNETLVQKNNKRHIGARAKDEATKKLKRVIGSDHDKSTTKLTEFKESDYEAERKEKIERMKSVSFRSVRMLEACGQSLDNFFTTKPNNEERIEKCSENKASKKLKRTIDLDCNESEVELAKLREPGYDEENRGRCVETRAEKSSLEHKESEAAYEDLTPSQNLFSEPNFPMDIVNDEVKKDILDRPQQREQPVKKNFTFCGLQEEFSDVPKKSSSVQNQPNPGEFLAGFETSGTKKQNVTHNFDVFEFESSSPGKNPDETIDSSVTSNETTEKSFDNLAQKCDSVKNLFKSCESSASYETSETDNVTADFDVSVIESNPPGNNPLCDETGATIEPSISPSKTTENCVNNLVRKKKEKTNSQPRITVFQQQFQDFRKSQIKKKVLSCSFEYFDSTKKEYKKFKRSGTCANCHNNLTSVPEHDEEKCVKIPISADNELVLSRPFPKFDIDSFKFDLSEECFESEFSFKTLPIDQLVNDCLKDYGVKYVQTYLEPAIKFILNGFSILWISSDLHKSLCYQIAAYCYWLLKDAITIVISPRISLVQYRIKKIPRFLKAVYYHSSQTESENNDAIKSIINGHAQILFITPEFLLEGFQRIDFSLFPKIGFVCIDEVHCLTEWSVDFYPSYLQLFNTLASKFDTYRFLGMSTAVTHETAQAISKILRLPSKCWVIGQTKIPKNLVLSIENSKQTRRDLVNFLKLESVRSLKSVLIYCTSRCEADSLAIYIRASLQFEKNFKDYQYFCEAYHDGLPYSQQSTIEQNFRSGKLRIVVATKALGMRIEKDDIRCIIHFSMPKSLENYVQEICVAGRDGEPSYCHLFLNPNDLISLQAPIYNATCDYKEVETFLRHVYKPCECRTFCEMFDTEVTCPSHLVTVPISLIDNVTNINSEVLQTLLFSLEKLDKYPIEIRVPFNHICVINFFGEDREIEKFIADDEVLRFAVAYVKQNYRFKSIRSFQFNIASIATLLEMDVMDLRRHLAGLQWNKKSKSLNHLINVGFTGYSFHLKAPGILTQEDLNVLSSQLHKMVLEYETNEINKLRFAYAVLNKLSLVSATFAGPNAIRSFLNIHFSFVHETKVNWEGLVKQSYRQYLPPQLYDENLGVEQIWKVATFLNDVCKKQGEPKTPRDIARILHGLISPGISYEEWSQRYQFWGALVKYDFAHVKRICDRLQSNF